jgi:DNA helicase HerA-like ATPase
MIDEKQKLPDAIENPEREVVFVAGKTGFGKSNYLKGYLSELKRVIILDPLAEYPGLEFDDIAGMISHLESINAKNLKTEFCVKSCNVLDLENLCEIVADGDRRDDPNAMRDIHFIVEEAQRCIPASGERLPEALKKIIFQGRHFKRHIIIAAQRPSLVNIMVRSQWNRIVAFNLTEPADTDWIRNTSGFDIESEDDIKMLPMGDYLEITPGSIERKHAPLYIPKREKMEAASPFDELMDIFSMFNLQTN